MSYAKTKEMTFGTDISSIKETCPDGKEELRRAKVTRQELNYEVERYLRVSNGLDSLNQILVVQNLMLQIAIVFRKSVQQLLTYCFYYLIKLY